MLNLTEKNAARSSKTSPDTENALAGYSSDLRSAKKSKHNLLNDDLIVSLSDAYENKRARQVFEWESRQKHAA